jgi:hypothetical protein
VPYAGVHATFYNGFFQVAVYDGATIPLTPIGGANANVYYEKPLAQDGSTIYQFEIARDGSTVWVIASDGRVYKYIDSRINAQPTPWVWWEGYQVNAAVDSAIGFVDGWAA